MKRRLSLLAVLTTSLAMAQTTVPAAGPTATISGVVRDKVAQQPLANFTVTTSASNPNRQVQSTTDAQGHYQLAGLPPGRYRIVARGSQRFFPQAVRFISVAGQDLDNIDISVPVDATIGGKVIDENGEPVPGGWVFLVSREYFLGAAGYFLAGVTRVDDQGQYSFPNVSPDRAYLLLSAPRPTTIPAHSEVPLNPKFRRRVAMRTWYPNSPDRDGATPLLLRPGENREGTDIEVRKSPSYCVEGATIGPNGPASMHFQIEALQPSSGLSNTGGMYTVAPNGMTGPDGKLRICDLSPGQYRMEIQTSNVGSGQAPANFGVTNVVVKDEDQRNLKFLASPGLTLDGEVVWDTPPPDTAPSVKVSIQLRPTLRTGFPGAAEWNPAKADIPGAFSFPGLFPDDYAVWPTVRGAGLYIKEVTYSSRSVLHEPLRYGSAMLGSGLRVVVGRDGGKIATQLADKDGHPIADAHVTLFPVDAETEGLLAAKMVTGQTDQLGQYTSETLPPGKYYVLASDEEFDATLESIAKLWRSRTGLKQVDLAPNGSAQVNLELVKLM
jgi:hypothetical protein